MELFKDKSIIITGAGSLGSTLVKKILEYGPKTIRIIDNHEMQLVRLQEQIGDEKNVRYLLGDVRDLSRMKRACEEMDYVIHTAAYKQVPMGEYDPHEFYLTNITGTQNVIEACLENNVNKMAFISSDKAVSALNLYGKSKAMAEGLVTTANFCKGKRRQTRFFTCRYGNVLGSRGSVVPVWKEQAARNSPLTLTKGEMTRFNLTMQEGIDFIFRSLQVTWGAEVFVPKLKAYYVRDLLEAFKQVTDSNHAVEEIPIRPGEKLHELLINESEMRTAVIFGPHEDYAILPDESIIKRFDLRYYLDEPLKFPEPTAYSSETAEKLTVNELKEILLKEGLV